MAENQNIKDNENQEEQELKNKPTPWWNYMVGVGLIIGIFAGIAEISGFSVKDLWSNKSVETDYFDIAVFVHGKEGKHQQILENKGKVVMQLSTDKRDEKIGDKGEVNFKQLPANFKNQKVTFYLTDTEDEPYQVVNPKTEYELIPNEAIHLEVLLKNLDHIKGTVRDKVDPSKRLPNVKVCIEDICVNTNDDGRFLLQIPENLQRKFQTISFRKKGFEEFVKHNVPMQLEGDFDVVMKAKN